MSTLVATAEVTAVDMSCTSHTLNVVLSDGRTVSVPLAWFPRLLAATPKQRAQWEMIGGGIGIHWDAVDEDISVASLLQPEKFMRLPNKRIQSTRQKRRVPVRRPVARA
ncbi:MAG: DUF2442 domain-containing protein [Nitrospirae bacterium]|nr:DUF2442 domain-containing protein [Nitrospirota bacterium]